MRDAIIDHLYSKKLIRDTQHGFTQGRSCLTNLLLEEVTAYVDEGSPVDVLYLDFSKAFFFAAVIDICIITTQWRHYVDSI